MPFSLKERNGGLENMRKNEYIDLLITDNETAGVKKKLYADIIDCTDIALSQEDDNFEVDTTIGLEELWNLIQDEGKKDPNHCVGPFQAAELIAKRIGAKYIRASMRNTNMTNTTDIVNLEDFF